MSKIKWVCPNCGSRDIDELTWVNVNTAKVTSAGPGEKEDTFCNGCSTHIVPIEDLKFQELIDRVLESMKIDFRHGDITAVEEILKFIPEDILEGYTPLTH